MIYLQAKHAWYGGTQVKIYDQYLNHHDRHHPGDDDDLRHQEDEGGFATLQ